MRRRRYRPSARSRPGPTRGHRWRHPNPTPHAGGVRLAYAPTVCYPCCVAQRNALRRDVPDSVRHRVADSVPHGGLHDDPCQPVREHAHPHTDAWAFLDAGADCRLHAVRDADSIRGAYSVSYAISNALSDAKAHRHSESVGPIDRRHG